MSYSKEQITKVITSELRTQGISDENSQQIAAIIAPSLMQAPRWALASSHTTDLLDAAEVFARQAGKRYSA